MPRKHLMMETGKAFLGFWEGVINRNKTKAEGQSIQR